MREAEVELFCEDSIAGMRKRLADGSVRHFVTSIPFGALFSYSHKVEDIGNTRDGVTFIDSQFGLAMRFWFAEVERVLAPGCVAAIHVQQLNTTQVKHGYQGIRDFRGAVIDMGRKHGLNPHGEVAIPKNPQRIAQVRKLHSLLFVTGRRDSRALAPANNDFVLFFRKPGDGVSVAGLFDKVKNPGGQFTQEQWIRWARGCWEDGWANESEMLELEGYEEARDAFLRQEWQSAPIWNDILETDVLDGWRGARATDEEKHVCLAKGSLVLTYDGYRPIQEVQIGNLVLTHEGRWRPVTAVACTGTKPVRRLYAHGVPGLMLTDDHRIWARDVRGLSAKRAAAERRLPAWLPADEAQSCYANLKLPPIEESPLSRDEWWIIGRWLADGHVGSRGEVVISAGYHESDALLKRLGSRAGTVAWHRTCAQIRVRDRAGRLRAVISRCGRGAAGKVVPGEALALEALKAKAFLDGYLSGDGHLVLGRQRWMATTVSRPLALGMAMIAQRAYGVVASVSHGKPAGKAVIEGRSVTTLDEWTVSFELPRAGRHNRPFIEKDGAWKRVRSCEVIGEAEVWDITVDEDHSFTAEGCIVENCPLQLEVIRRSLLLYTNPGDLVCDPFMGIGSTAAVCVELGRDCIGFELKESYHKMALRNVERWRERVRQSDPQMSLAEVSA